MSQAGKLAIAAALAAVAAATAGCQPRVAVEAPKEPIVIQMNIKIEHEIKVQVDRKLDDLIASEKDIF